MKSKEIRCDGLQKPRPTDRRAFLRQVGAGGLAAAAGASLPGMTAGAAPAAPSAPAAGLLPTIKIGDKTFTRMLAGGNPVQGYSHAVQNLTQHMMEYFTVEQTAKFILHCEEVGINTFQCSYSDKVRDALLKAWDSGSKIQYMCLTADDATQTPLDKIVPLKPVAISHHGVVTDSRFREGKPELIHDYIKKVHDKGMLAGVSSHNPNNIRAAEEKDWEVDFFMTCFYNVVRTDEEVKQEFGQLLVGEVYGADDPRRMIEVIRQSKKVCLAFKILAAGRHCWTPFSVERQFQLAFKSIKPTDAIIVGMYPRFQDEPKINAGYVRKYGTIKA